MAVNTYRFDVSYNGVYSYYSIQFYPKSSSVPEVIKVNAWFKDAPETVYKIRINSEARSTNETSGAPEVSPIFFSNGTFDRFFNTDRVDAFTPVTPTFIPIEANRVITYEVIVDTDVFPNFQTFSFANYSFTSYGNIMIFNSPWTPYAYGDNEGEEPPTEPVGPTATPDTFTTAYETPKTFNVVANDIAGSSVILTNSLAIKDSNETYLESVNYQGGLVVANDDGTISITPSAGYSGSFVVPYRITDTNGLHGYTDITVTVEAAPVPVGPTANPNSFTTPFNTTVTVNLVSDDYTGSSPILVEETVLFDGTNWVKALTNDSGSYTVDVTGVLTVVPTTGYYGTVNPVTYRITDSNGLTSESTVSGTVSPPVGPTAGSATFASPYNGSVTFSILNKVTAGAGSVVPSSLVFVDGENKVKTLTTTSGTYTINNGSGTATFVASENATGTVSQITYEITDSNGMKATGTVSGSIAAPPTPPTANPAEFTVEYETTTVLSVLKNTTAGTYAIEPASLEILENGIWVKTLTNHIGTYTVNANGTITFVPKTATTGEGNEETFRIADVNGTYSESYFKVTLLPEEVVEENPERPYWVVGSFKTGYIDLDTDGTRWRVPFLSDRIYKDIHGKDEASFSVPCSALGAKINDWKTIFDGADGKRMAANIGIDGEVKAYGEIVKRTFDAETWTITVVIRGVKGYLDTITAVKAGVGFITSETSSWTETGSPGTVVKKFIQEVFIPEDSPKNFIFPEDVAGGYSVTTIDRELRTIGSIIEQVSGDPYGGAEVLLVPEIQGNRILVNLVEGNPAINDTGNPVSVLDLGASSVMASSFTQVEDFQESYSRLYLENGKEDFTKEGIYISHASRDVGPDGVRHEAKERFDAELSLTDLSAQFEARLADSKKPDIINNIVLFDDAKIYPDKIGERILINGSGQSAGISSTMRITGATWSSMSPGVELALDEIKRVYPRVPSPKDDIRKEIEKSTLDSSFKPSKPSTGGTDGPDSSIPDNPGEWDLPSLFGDQGRSKYDNNLKNLFSPKFSGYKKDKVTKDLGNGVWTMLPGTITQNEGNWLYGLDHFVQAWETQYASNGTEIFNLNGGINVTTGMPETEPIKPYHIRKTWIKEEGGIGDITEMGVVPAEKITEMMETWETHPDLPEFLGGWLFQRGIMASIFTVDGRLYFCMLDGYRSLFVRGGFPDKNSTEPKIGRSKVSVISANILPDGNLDNDWVLEPGFNFNNGSETMNMIPHPDAVSRYGKNIVIGGGWKYPKYFKDNVIYDSTIDSSPWPNDPVHGITEIATSFYTSPGGSITRKTDSELHSYQATVKPVNIIKDFSNRANPWKEFVGDYFGHSLYSLDGMKSNGDGDKGVAFYSFVYNRKLYGVPYFGQIKALHLNSDGTPVTGTIDTNKWEYIAGILPNGDDNNQFPGFGIVQNILAYEVNGNMGWTRKYRKIKDDGSVGEATSTTKEAGDLYQFFTQYPMSSYPAVGVSEENTTYQTYERMGSRLFSYSNKSIKLGYVQSEPTSVYVEYITVNEAD